MTFPKLRNWRFNARYGALAFLAMSLSACSLEERKTARVFIDLSELHSERAASSRWASSSVNATAMSTPAQPTWGNGGRALTSYSELDCVLLNVMGEGIPSPFAGLPAIRPDKWDLNNICSYIYPGTFSIPASLDQANIELSISVQKGPSRLVQVLGFKKAATLRCEDVTLPMIVESDGVNVSNLHELGKAKVDLMSDATVEIQGNIASAKSVSGCGGGEMVVPFSMQGIWIPTTCKSGFADVYLRKKFADGTLGVLRSASSSSRVSCVSGSGPAIAVNPLSTAALAAQGSETAVSESDSLVLDIRWYTTAAGTTEAALPTLISARYDVTAPTGAATLALDVNLAGRFIANFANLSEAGRASIVSGTCGMASPQVAPEVNVSAGASQVALQSGQTLTAGATYHLLVRDFAGNAYCPSGASVTFGGTSGGGTSYLFQVANPPMIGNPHTVNGSTWNVTGQCNTNYVDSIQLFDGQNVPIGAQVSCLASGFTIPAGGPQLYGDGTSGVKSFYLRSYKQGQVSGGDYPFNVVRDLVYPGVNSATLSTSGTGSSAVVTGSISGVMEDATWMLMRGDSASNCQTAVGVGTGIVVTAGQNSSTQNNTVTVPAGVSRFFVGIKDAAGNLNCPNLNGSNLNYVEYTNASAGTFTLGFQAGTSLVLTAGQTMGGPQVTTYTGAETIVSCVPTGFMPSGLTVGTTVISGKNQCAINGTPTGLLPYGQQVTVRATASSGATGDALLTIIVNSPTALGQILVLGGQDSASGSALPVEVFSKVTGSRITSSYSPLPTNGAGYTGWMESAGVKLPDGSILIAGGRSLAGVPHNLAYRLVPGTTTWQPVGPLNVARYGHTMTVIPSSGEVVVVGGANAAGAALMSVEVFDPLSRVFNPRTQTLSVGRYGHAAQLLMPAGASPSIAVIGGRTSVVNSSSATNLVDRIGVVQGTGWTVLPTSFPGLPVGLSMLRAATDDNLHVLTVTGGYSSAGSMSASSYSMDTLNPSGGWGASVAMGASRAEHLVVKLNNDATGVRFMAFGGGQATSSATMEVLAMSGGTFAWNAFSPSSLSTVLPTLRGAGIARLDSTGLGGNEKFLILGGTLNGTTFNPDGVIVTTPASGSAQMTTTDYISMPGVLTTPRSDFLLIDF